MREKASSPSKTAAIATGPKGTNVGHATGRHFVSGERALLCNIIPPSVQTLESANVRFADGQTNKAYRHSGDLSNNSSVETPVSQKPVTINQIKHNKGIRSPVNGGSAVHKNERSVSCERFAANTK